MSYNTSTGAVSAQRYTPYGAPRGPASTLPTDYRPSTRLRMYPSTALRASFTGQRSEEAGLGSLYDYNARHYSPQVGMFISADTLVPSPMAPQSLNRYAYVGGNPINHRDPTGHACDDGPQTYAACYGNKPVSHAVMRAADTYQGYGTWTYTQVKKEWRWLNGRFNAVAYTRSEMVRNVSSAQAAEIRSLNSKTDAVSKAQANLKWAQMVAPGRAWDHKPYVRDISASLEPANKERTDWQQVGREEYRFDTWSNIHYGYVGRSAGFSTEWLLTGASLAQFGDDLLRRKTLQYNPENGGFLNRFDDIPDQAAIALGAKLWEHYGVNGVAPTQEQFIQALQATPLLERRPDQGGQP